MEKAFSLHIKEQFPQLFDNRFLIAISGGLDSVVLTHLLHANSIDFELAHCNFNLRNTESDADEQFVKHLGKELNLKVHSKHFQTKKYASENGVSTQMAARDLRYNWFFEIRKKENLAAVLTAHHLDDQIETFFINLNRGAGLSGLTGIPENANQILRPLLPFSRADILEYAHNNNLEWREDSSNQSNDYQRNQLRNQVLPLVHQALPQFKDNFTKTLDYLKDVEAIVDDAVVRFRESVTTTNSSGIDIQIDKLLAYKNYDKYLFYMLQPYGFKDVDEVLDLIKAQTGKFISSAEYELSKDRELLRLELKTEVQKKEWQIFPETKMLELRDSIITLDHIQTSDPIHFLRSNDSKNVLLLDTEGIEYPLTLRYWETGDRLEPFGMNGSQLVSDILTNNKVSRSQKSRSLVLKSNDKTLWVIGQRSSRYHLITNGTREILKITWSD